MLLTDSGQLAAADLNPAAQLSLTDRQTDTHTHAHTILISYQRYSLVLLSASKISSFCSVSLLCHDDSTLGLDHQRGQHKQDFTG